MLYFDWSATTKPDEDILELHQRINKEYWYNSETLYHEGQKSNALYLKAKQNIIDKLKLYHKEILFTSGATEGNNTALYGYLNRYLNKGCHVITSIMEHASVLNVFKDLENRGLDVTYLKPTKDGIIDINELKDSIKNNTILISIMWVNNIIGSIQPIKEIIDIKKQYPKIKLHVDCVQGFSKIPNDFDFNDLDFMVLSSHKLGGIKGTGCLIYNDKIELSFLKGGHQQNSLRPGTLDLAGCVTTSKIIERNLLPKDYYDVLKKYQYLVNELENLEHLVLIRSTNYYSPYILNINFKYMHAETVLHLLDERGIIVGTGSACNSKSKDSEPTLNYILPYFGNNLNPINSIRISLNKENTMEDIKILIKNIKEIGLK